MAKVTKYRCDHCAKEVEDPYLEAGWINISGHFTRSWGQRTKGKNGDGQTDYLNGQEFCGIECLVRALDILRKRANGPPVTTPAPQPSPPALGDLFPDEDESPPLDGHNA